MTDAWPQPNRAILSLGGNVGDVVGAFAFALDSLGGRPGNVIIGTSSVWRTPPWGMTDQPDFLNMAADLATLSEPRALLAECLELERAAGRVRAERWGPRTLDIDIIVFGDITVETEELTLPHPRAHERAFVLAPLAELAPDIMLRGRSPMYWLASTDMADCRIDPAATQRLKHALTVT